MRLIDADKLADALFEQRKNYPQWVADTIGNMPDAVVRCKDCKHWIGGGIDEKDNFIPPRCKLNNIIAQHNWYCADGEKRCDDG
jgi:hypothetical protein